MESWWENLDPVRKLDVCNCCNGLDVDGEKFVRTERSAIPGMLTGAELPSRPELARPADIELPIGEFVSLWIDSTKFNGSSRCSSSNAFPETQRRIVDQWPRRTATNTVNRSAYLNIKNRNSWKFQVFPGKLKFTTECKFARKCAASGLTYYGLDSVVWVKRIRKWRNGGR